MGVSCSLGMGWQHAKIASTQSVDNDLRKRRIGTKVKLRRFRTNPSTTTALRISPSLNRDDAGMGSIRRRDSAQLQAELELTDPHAPSSKAPGYEICLGVPVLILPQQPQNNGKGEIQIPATKEVTRYPSRCMSIHSTAIRSVSRLPGSHVISTPIQLTS
jgi:hypothetical protein